MQYTGFHRAIEILHGEQRHTWPICFCNLIETAELDRMRQRYRELNLPPPSYTSLVVKAIGIAVNELKEQYPEINSMLGRYFGWRRIHTFDTISAGVAISRDEEGADQAALAVLEEPHLMPLTQMTGKLHEFSTQPVRDVHRMRNCHYLYRLPMIAQRVMLWIGRTFPTMRRRYRGTFALTSVGKFGVDYQITLPQASCLSFGFGSIADRAVVRDGQVIAARCFHLTLSFDRRLMNGKPCALLMERIREILNHAQYPDWEDLNTQSPGLHSRRTPADSPEISHATTR